jgi:Bacteriophage tail sheath protein
MEDGVMASFTYPGVYIEELSSGQHTITGVATSIAAFIGWAPQGPVTEATLVQSWSDYQAIFGGLDSRSKLGYAVNQFFANGGAQCYIVRLVWDGSIPAASGNPAPCETAVATGVGYATAQITASVGSISGSASVGIGQPVLQSIAVTPAAMPPMPIGATVTLSATPTYSDGGNSPALASTAVNWESSNPSVVSVVANTGVATAMGTGTASTATAILTATSGLVSGSITVTVTAANLEPSGLVVVIPSSVAVGQRLQLVATAAYTDGTTPVVTQGVAWTSGTPADADFTGVPTPPPGQVSGLAAGSSVITATIPWAIAGVSPSATGTLTVDAAVVTSAAVYPANPILDSGETTTFTIWGTLSSVTPNPPLTELTASGWVSSNLSVATVSSVGVIAVVGPGTTTITGTSGTTTASTTLTVNTAALKSISVSPAVLSVASGLSQQLKATGIYADGTSADLTGSVAWTGDAESTILPNGLLTGNAGVTVASTGTISAAWQGQTASATVTVTPPVLQTISVSSSPSSTSIPSGQTLQFNATGTYSDGSTPAITPTWSASPSGLITITSLGAATATAAGGSLTLFASSPGVWGNNLRVSITTLPAPNSSRFNLLVQQVNSSGVLQTLESFVNLSVSPTDPSYVVTVIDNDSSYITFIDPANGNPVVPTAAPSATPALSPIALGGGADGAVLQPTDGNFELALTFYSTAGVYLLDRVDIFNLLCIPGETDAPTISTLQQFCNLKRAFFIVDAPPLSTISNLISSGPVGSSAGSITGEYAINSAFYFPWISAPDPLAGNRPSLFPPCGFVAGIYAATDASRGVWKAPAGINAGLTGNSGLQYVLTDAENGSLNTQAVNCLRQFKVYGDVVWGARTLAGNDQAGSQWKYVPIRRLALFLESSLFDGTQWVVFEPNDETLWGQIRLNVGAFMQGLFLHGAFAGTTPQQAYFVKCDGENNPAPSVALGIVNILVGFAPLYPAEFVVIQIQQIVAQS